MTEVRFTVPGILPGWQRAGGNGSRRFTQDQTRNAEAEVAAWGRQAMAGRELLAGPLGFDLKVFYPIPRGMKAPDAMKAQKAGGMPMPKKPDFDNLSKLIGDALNGVCYKDDAAITDWSGCKRYGVTPRAEVRLWQVEGEG